MVGYFVLNHKNIVGLQSFFGQLWKEYALSDSRYLSQDPFVLCVETITVCAIGPLCFLTAYLTAVSHPMHHALQIIVSVGHIYSDLLYFATSALAYLKDGISYSRPEAIYFWGYYVGWNLIWIVIPACIIYGDVKTIAEAIRVADKSRKKAEEKERGTTPCKPRSTKFGRRNHR